MEQKILLNFIPFKSENFSFNIYRKEYQKEKKEQLDSDVYRYTLPKNENLNDISDYLISLNPRENFEKFNYFSNYNLSFTEYFIYIKIVEKIKQKLLNNDYILPEKKYEGKVVYLILREHIGKGKECLLIKPYYYSYNKKLGLIVNFRFRKDSNIAFDREIQRLSLSLDRNYKSNANFYIDKYEKLNLFRTQFYSKIFPLEVGDKSLELEDRFIEVSPDALAPKSYLFNENKEEKYQFIGIDKLGPYSPIENSIELILFSEEKNKLFASDLEKALKGESFPTFKGISKFFRVSNISFKWVPIDLNKKEDSVHTIKETLSNNKDAFPIVIHSKQNSNAYYYIKYELLKDGIPTQFVSIETLKDKQTFKWSVSGIALQIFSKIGGIPWLVKPETNRTLIIGIGQSHQKIKEGENYKIKKYFSYSVLIDSSGRYKELKILGNSEVNSDYLSQLKESIQKIIKDYSTDFENFVIHVPFKIRRDELDSIKQTIENVGNTKTFIVIRINIDNDFFGFNSNQNSLVPYESTYINLSSKEFLVWFEGLQSHNPVINRRISGPVYIEFYYSNKELTMDIKRKYLQDILNLSGANWRGFNAKMSPISVFYPQLVAKFLKYFDNYSEINVENIKPWFL